MENRILLDIPESFETRRLIIRVPRAGDGASANEAIGETLEELGRWMAWAKERPSVAETEEFCRRAYSRFLAREDFVLRLVHKESGEFVGSSGLHPRDWAVPRFETGYWCRKRFMGQGYITEAVRGILGWGFGPFKARRIEIRCDVLNVRSIKVAERVGMRREGILRNYAVRADGSVEDTVVFGMTEGDWAGGAAGGGGNHGAGA